jgi:luciferase family oxidoreductase group 1
MTDPSVRPAAEPAALPGASASRRAPVPPRPVVPLSVLDLAPVAAHADHGQALAYTTALARQVESWGYRRFWVAEHHAMPAIASSSPPVLIAHLAGATSTIRVGSGGVMLPNHAPLVVAEQFGTLEALHPGRIDLGIGRAPGTDQRTAAALRRTTEGLGAEEFPYELMDVIAMLSGDPERLPATPRAAELPEIWLLGSSGYSAQLAGMLGLPFSFAHHFSSDNTDAALDLYRQRFRPSQWLSEPHTMIAVNAVVADTDDRAEWLSMPGIVSFLALRAGRPRPLLRPEEAAQQHLSIDELAFVEHRRRGQLLGGPATVAAQLAALLDRTGADEVMATNQVYELTDRLRSYQLLAEVAGLLPTTQAAESPEPSAASPGPAAATEGTGGAR